MKIFPFRSYSISIHFLVCGLLGFLMACQTSPTGRKQLALVPESQVNEMGVQAFEELKQKQTIETDPKINSYVRCVADSITSTLDGGQKWEVVVFKEDSPNAFALPGGKIGVHTGILSTAKTPDQLAAVLGHEVGHVLAKHSQERVSETLAAQGGLTLLSVILGNKNDSRRNLLMAALGVGAQFGVLLPHGRRQEIEADVLGLGYMAQAGFAPEESVTLWKNMEKESKGQPPEFLSTHPSHGTRIETLQSNMQPARQKYENSSKRPNCKV